MSFACLVASAAAFIAQQQRPRTTLRAVDVSLEKPLGMVLEENVRDAPEGLYVAEIDSDGSASACADIKVEDRLDAVNGVDTTSMGFDDVMDMTNPKGQNTIPVEPPQLLRLMRVASIR